MIRTIMHGCNGRMGQVIAELLAEDKEMKIVAGIDPEGSMKNNFPVFTSFELCDVKADVVIDFANAAATPGLLDYCMETLTPVVLCTTGMSEEQLKKTDRASEKVAVLRSANMSLGVNMLLKLVQTAAKILTAADFDVEIIEKHHNQKVDAPSGTALALADAVNSALSNEYTYVYDRSKERKKRAEKEIGIMALRGGTIVGEHDVVFAGNDEVVTFSHTAYSKAVFAKGAVQAAKFLAGKPAGFYDMSDVIG